MQNEAEKQSYVEFFANRNIGRSPSKSSSTHFDIAAEKARVESKLHRRDSDATISTVSEPLSEKRNFNVSEAKRYNERGFESR